MKPPQILIVIGDASETVDTLYPHLRVQEEGIVPVVIGPEQRRYQMVLHEKPATGWDITREFEGYTLDADLAFAQVRPEDYLGIFFSGGRAPEYIRYDPDLVRITRHFFAHDKPVASVCHGVEIPAYAGVLKGRRMATVKKCAHDLEVCGGIFEDAPCVIDRNLVSGRTWHDHGKYMKHWIDLLKVRIMMIDSPMMEVRRVVFEREQSVATRSTRDAFPLEAHHVLIRTRYSCISAGTELAKLSGLQKIAFPWVPGNRAIGRIVGVGGAVSGLKADDLVFAHSAHASLALNQGMVMKIPDALDVPSASTLGMALVALCGIQTAEASLGDYAVVVGGGLVGQYAAQLLELSGVETILVDISPGRLALASRCGISHAVASAPSGAERTRIMDITRGKGAQTVIDCTGVPAVIASSLGYAARSATVVLCGSPRGAHHSDLTAFLNNFHLWQNHGNLTLKGSHEWKLPTHHIEYVKHSMEGNLEILARLAMSGRLRCAELTNRVYDPAQAARAYQELQRETDAVVGAVFDWTLQGKPDETT